MKRARIAVAKHAGRIATAHCIPSVSAILQMTYSSMKEERPFARIEAKS